MTQTENLFNKIVHNFNFSIAKHLEMGEIPADLKKYADWALGLVEKNLAEGEEVKKFFGKVKDEELKKLEEDVKKALDTPAFAPEKKNLEKIFEKYFQLLRKLIQETIILVIPVKDLPFPEVTFRIAPMIIWPPDKIEKMNLSTDRVVFTADIPGVISRTTLYGKMKDADPLFAPLIGDLDLGAYKIDPEYKGPKSRNPEYVDHVLLSLDSAQTRNHVVRYNTEYQRHGQPICDFLMRDDKLLEVMKNLKSGLDTKRQISNASIVGLALKEENSTFVLTTTEGGRTAKDIEAAFVAIMTFSAALFDCPSTKVVSASGESASSSSQEGASGSGTSESGSTPTTAPSTGSAAPAQAPQAPPQPQLAMWTEAELEEQAKARSLEGLNMAVWTEEELEKDAKSRGDMLNLPVWSEEELEEDYKKRMGQIDIPEWKEEGSIVCSKCGYTMAPGWDECPVCGGPPNKKVEAPSGSSDEKEEYEEVEEEVEIEEEVEVEDDAEEEKETKGAENSEKKESEEWKPEE